MLPVEESLELLQKHKIPVARFAVVKSAKSAAAAARKLGFPVVMKIVSEKHTHKTDVGGVITHLDDADEVAAAYRKLSKLSRTVMVQKQIDGVETIIGIKRDPTFGCVILFGIGGIFVEIMRDVSFRVCPISMTDASHMIKELKASEILVGARGKRCNLDAVRRLLVDVSHLPNKLGIQEMDLNPVIVNSAAAYVVDARIRL